MITQHVVALLNPRVGSVHDYVKNEDKLTVFFPAEKRGGSRIIPTIIIKRTSELMHFFHDTLQMKMWLVVECIVYV